MSSQLEHWLAAESAQRKRLDAGPGPGVTPLEAVARMTGLQMLQEIGRAHV